MRRKNLVLASAIVLGLTNQFAVAEEIASGMKCNDLELEADFSEIKTNSKKVEKLAVVIGNSEYIQAKKNGELSDYAELPRTISDAEKIAEKFSKSGYHVVYAENTEQKDMERQICKMGYLLKHHPEIKTVSFYYAGHGTQDPLTKDNLLIPTDMDTFSIVPSFIDCTTHKDQKDKDNEICRAILKTGKNTMEGYEGRVINVNHILSTMHKYDNQKRAHLVILDACRSNGIRDKGKNEAVQVALAQEREKRASRGGGLYDEAGLEQALRSSFGSVGAISSAMNVPKNSVVAFASGVGMEAKETYTKSTGEKVDYENGIYTHHLLEHLFKPSVSLKQALESVTAGVRRDTEGKQIPRYDASMDEDVYLAGQQDLRPTVNN